MRHLRSCLALLAMAAVTAACSAAPGSSSGGENQPSTASQPSQAAASSGGGGGGGANGSATYEITGDATKSGELAFTYINGGISQFIDTGWVAYFYSEDEQTIIQVNSQGGTDIVNFADGEIVVVGSADLGCKFDYSQNDASGLKGTIDCPTPVATNAAGEQIHVTLHVTVDAHT